MKRPLSFLLFIAVLIAACTQQHKPVNSEVVEKVNKRKNNPWNIHVVDSSVGLLQTGDIVVRCGNDMTSYMLCQLNSQDKTYSHCGLVLVEDGYPYVYHCIGGEDNPDQVLRRDSASFWLSAARNEAYGIVRTDIADSSLTRLNKLAKTYYRQRKKFDMQFNIATEDRFYCAEFIYKTFNRSTGDSLFIKPVTVMGYTFVGIDNLFLNSHARFVCQIRFK
jgi:hypothetical protein